MMGKVELGNHRVAEDLETSFALGFCLQAGECMHKGSESRGVSVMSAEFFS